MKKTICFVAQDALLQNPIFLPTATVPPVTIFPQLVIKIAVPLNRI